MKLTWDFSELLEFADRLEKYDQFESAMMDAARELAKVLHKALLTHTPVLSGKLRQGWNGNANLAYTVKAVSGGYEVEFVNETEYATWVNDGHRQRPGRFIPGRWEGKHFTYDRNSDTGMVLKAPWVKGRFFVEKSIIVAEDKAERLIYKELDKWWKWCVNG